VRRAAAIGARDSLSIARGRVLVTFLSGWHVV
jgi:hypothetical protein